MFYWASHSNFAGLIAIGQWEKRCSNRFKETLDKYMPESFISRTWLSILNIQLRKSLKSWLPKMGGQTRKWIMLHILSFILSHKHMLLDAAGDRRCARWPFDLLYCSPPPPPFLVAYSPSWKGTSLQLCKRPVMHYSFLKSNVEAVQIWVN